MGATQGGGGSGAALEAAGKGRGSTSSRSRSTARKEGKRRGPQRVQEQRQQGPAKVVGQLEEQGLGWAVVAYEASTGRLCTGYLQSRSLRELEYMHLASIHASLGVWRLLHIYQPWQQLPGNSGPGALPSVYDTARLSTAAARAVQRILHGESTFGRQGSALSEQQAVAVLPRNIVFLRDLVWGDLALGWEWLGAAEAQRCMPYWLEAGAVALGMVVEGVEAGAGAGVGGPAAGAGTEVGGGADAGPAAGSGVPGDSMSSVQHRDTQLGADPASNTLRLMEALDSMLHGAPGGLPAAYRQLPPEVRTHSALRLHAARLLPTLGHLMRREARGAFDGCAAHAASAEPASAQRTVHGLVCRLLTGLGDPEPGPRDSMPAAAAWRWGLCNVRLQQGLRAQAVGLAVTAAKWGRRVAAAAEALTLPPPPPQAKPAGTHEQQAAAAASVRREWVCQLRRALGCLSLLAVLVRVMLPALEYRQEAGDGEQQAAGGGDGEGPHCVEGAANAKAASDRDMEMEALSLCLRVGCQLAAAALHTAAHHQQEAQGAGKAASRGAMATVGVQGAHQAEIPSSMGALTEAEAYGAVRDALVLMQALGVCAADAPQLPWRQLLAAQPQRLVAACCEVWMELAAAAQRGGGRAEGGDRGDGEQRGGPKGAAAALGCKLGYTLACTLARVGTHHQLRPYLRAWLAPQAAAEAAAEEAGERESTAAAAAAADYARLMLAAGGISGGEVGRTTPNGPGDACGSRGEGGGSSGGGGGGSPRDAPWRQGVISNAALLLLAAVAADSGGGVGSIPHTFALLYQLREAARGGGGVGDGSGSGAGGPTHQFSWEDTCRGLGTSLHCTGLKEAATSEPQGSAALELPVSPQVVEAWVKWLQGTLHVALGAGAAAGRLELPHSLPPVLGGAAVAVGYRGLRLCGNPCCGNFTGVAEAGLHLKHCAGCMAVRYCGADCQRAHWREGHRRECKALQALQREEVA